MVHWNLGVISPILNCIDGETEAREEKTCPRAQSFRQKVALAARKRRLLKSSTQPADWHLLLSPQFSVCLCFRFLVYSCDWYVCPLLNSGFSPIEPLGTVLSLIWIESLLWLLAWSWCYFWVCWRCFPLAPCWAWVPTCTGCDTQLVRDKNRAWSQSACVLCFIHSATLLPRITISLQKGKASLNVILCMWTIKWVWVHFNFALCFLFLPSSRQGQPIHQALASGV